MAGSAPYKQYSRQQRKATLETDFSHGMQYSNGPINEGYVQLLVNYDYEIDNNTLIPRAGIRPDSVIFPDLVYTPTGGYLDDGVAIKYSKDCVEDGNSYKQFIIGQLDEDSERLGSIWAITAKEANIDVTVTTEDDYTYEVGINSSANAPDHHKCYFYSAEAPSIHGTYLEKDDRRRVAFPVGTFAYGNSFYFIGEEPGETADDPVTAGMFKTKFSGSAAPYSDRYLFERVDPKSVTAAEAVTYGYNMLSPTPYTFVDTVAGSSVIQFLGILPYADAEYSTLMMTPKKNQALYLRCYYDAPANGDYDIVWEWRETTASDWNQLKRETVTFDSDNPPVLSYDYFIPSATDIMVRVSAYNNSETETDAVEKAMTVGFDFNVENHGAANSLDQKNYDLTTATGMATWKSRIVLWGVPEDPTILFISDYNEPSYFPYPNNITVFSEPIIYAVEFMDKLIVFTTDKVYEVSLSEDGSSWTSVVIQSHLSINIWDKHLIQTVRNMLFFKSGNYYYMMVPKAQSTTGELILAPITTPITGFFDNFTVNVERVIRDTYGFTDTLSLITYFNFLDYEDIHNTYVFKFDESSNAVLHFDIMYNTVDRCWKIWVYEAPHILYPYRNDATQTGVFAATSVLKSRNIDTSELDYRRFIQLFRLDKHCTRDFYLPGSLEFEFNPTFAPVYYADGSLVYPTSAGVVYSGGAVEVPDVYVADLDVGGLTYSKPDDYYIGYDTKSLIDMLNEVYNHAGDYYTFRNYQYLDTGYRTDNLHANKRYREIQLQVNNIDKKNIQFGMEYMLEGAPRGLYYKYNVSQVIDEMDPEYGVVYIDSVPYLEVELDNIDQVNQWVLDQELAPDISLWKVRVSVSGKGVAPRLRLHTRNEKRYEILGINWIYKLMNMR